MQFYRNKCCFDGTKIYHTENCYGKKRNDELTIFRSVTSGKSRFRAGKVKQIKKKVTV